MPRVQAATKELLPYLPNGHQVVLAAHGHISSFFTEQPEAGTRLINAFLASGEVDDSHYQPQTVDFAPATTLTTLARMFAGMILGLAFLTVLSLLWLARRVRQRGQLGDRTGATLRSVYLVVLGLSGWFMVGLLVSPRSTPPMSRSSARAVGANLTGSHWPSSSPRHGWGHPHLRN
jgi:hypothetical protein